MNNNNINQSVRKRMSKTQKIKRLKKYLFISWCLKFPGINIR